MQLNYILSLGKENARAANKQRLKNKEDKMTEQKKCAVCTGKSNKEVCDECNSIYSRTIGATFETEEQIKHFMENEDVPRHKLQKLGREMSIHIYGA